MAARSPREEFGHINKGFSFLIQSVYANVGYWDARPSCPRVFMELKVPMLRFTASIPQGTIRMDCIAAMINATALILLLSGVISIILVDSMRPVTAQKTKPNCIVMERYKNTPCTKLDSRVVLQRKRAPSTRVVSREISAASFSVRVTKPDEIRADISKAQPAIAPGKPLSTEYAVWKSSVDSHIMMDAAENWSASVERENCKIFCGCMLFSIR